MGLLNALIEQAKNPRGFVSEIGLSDGKYSRE